MMEWKFSQISMSMILVHDMINAMIMFKKFSQTTKSWADVPKSSAATPAQREASRRIAIFSKPSIHTEPKDTRENPPKKGDDLRTIYCWVYYQGK